MEDRVPDSVQNWATYRRMNYSVQLNYSNKFGNHTVGGMGNFSREQYATGSEQPHYRENWVFRATYDYASRYMVEYNGAYNGSEIFAKDNRFAFFNSGAIRLDGFGRTFGEETESEVARYAEVACFVW
mgnify:CR=1 FL=1